MSDVLTRAFAHARRRNESMETPLTPANEMTSWLSDDMCANCGSAVQGSRLYCSEQCREEDSQHQQQQQQRDNDKAAASATAFASTAGTSSPAVTDRPSATAPAFSRSAPRLTQRRSPIDQPSTQAEAKFRYPCPPSPHLLAKYKTSALTSPALTALERSLPSRHDAGGAEGTSISASSSDESSSRGGHMQGKRRSSSRSTFSSASTDNFSTVPSTPSPASRAAASSALIDDLDDLEPSDLCLPPSVKPASAVLLKSASRDASRSTSGDSSLANGGGSAAASGTPATTAPPATRRSPITKAATAPSPPPSTSASSTATMRYTRRPSSTNLPPPVLFTSPALTATHRINARGAPSSTSTAQQQATVTRKVLQDELRSAKRPSVTTNTFSSPAVLADSASGSSRAVSPPGVTAVAVAALPMTSQRVRGSKSPEQIASAASSAGKTLRAFSPSSADNNEAMCGRPGCRGAASSRESLVSPGPSSWGASYPSSPRSSGLDAAAEGNSSRRPSMTRGRGHQHTHSARGGLSLRTIAPGAGSAQAAATVLAKGLVMTPAILPADAPSRRRSSGAALASSPPALQSILNEDDGRGRSGRASTTSPSRRRAQSPGRGRSKARGHSSTSRRSPSPPRAAARRGVSQDLSLRSHSRANSTHAPNGVLSPTNAIEVPLPPSIGESPEAAADASGASLKRNLHRDAGPSPMALRSELEREQERDREASRRGRSPTERERGRGRDRGRQSNTSSSAADEFGRIEREQEHSPSRLEHVDVNSWAKATSEATWTAPAIAAAAAATASAVLSAKLVPAVTQATPSPAKVVGMDEALGYDEVDLELDD